MCGVAMKWNNVSPLVVNVRKLECGREGQEGGVGGTGTDYKRASDFENLNCELPMLRISVLRSDMESRSHLVSNATVGTSF